MDKIFEVKRTISFFLEKRKDSAGKLIINNMPIRVSVSFNGKRIMFFSGYRIDGRKWDEPKMCVKNNTFNNKGETAAQINGKLNNIAAGLSEYFKSCEVRRYQPNATDVKNAFALLFNAKKIRAISFYGAFDEFVKTVGSENCWSEAAYKKFTTIKNHLQAFDKNLSFESLTADKLTKLTDHYRTKKDYRNTYIEKNLKFIRWFLRWADKNSYEVNRAALDYRPNLKGTDGKIKKVIFLTKDELFHLYNLSIAPSKQYLQRVRDVFCFCCFTGLRYSDAYNLTKSSDKGTYIEFVTQKTHETLIVQLNKYSRALLDKYKDTPFEDGKALPVISNQRMNEYLKELGQLAELNAMETIVYYKGNRRVEETYPKHALLCTHCGRKTFVTNLIYMGVPDNVIKDWTGHKDNKSFEAYHKIVNEIKAREMAKWDEL